MEVNVAVQSGERLGQSACARQAEWRARGTDHGRYVEKLLSVCEV